MFDRRRGPHRRIAPAFQAGNLILAESLVLVFLCACPPGAQSDVTKIQSISSTGQPGDDISGRYAGPAISGDGRVVAFDSQATTLVPGDTNNKVDVFVHERDTAITERVSVSTSGIQANDISTRPAIDSTGDRVVFDSAASNLVAGDTNAALDVFVRTRSLQTTERVSVSTNGTQGNGASYGPTISADGRYVCFISSATNLVPNDTNSVEDVFVRDLATGATERVNLSSGGQQANSSSTLASISADGRWVVFISFANNLVPGDTNGQFDIFIHDRSSGLTERVNLDSNGHEADAQSSGPTVSEDGRFVAFWSDATNLVPGDTNGRRDVFVRDRTMGTTERVSVSSSGAQGDGNSPEAGVRGFVASSPQITPDGRYVAFFSSSANLVPGDTNVCPPSFQSPPGRCPDAFVRDRIAGTTTRVNLASDGSEANDRTADPSISASGQGVAFFSAAGNLVAGDNNTCPPIFPANCPDIFTHESVATSVQANPGSGAGAASLTLVAEPNPTAMVFELRIGGLDGGGGTLVIYDVRGRAVRTLASGNLSAGTLRWDGRDERGRRMESGTYFGRLTNGGHAVTRKITLVRG